MGVKDDKVGADILASEICKLSRAMQKIEASQLQRNTVVVLLHAKTGVSKKVIIKVLDNLLTLEQDWLKTATEQSLCA
jgi:plasmid maintenance system antidote protein VapI